MATSAVTLLRNPCLRPSVLRTQPSSPPYEVLKALNTTVRIDFRQHFVHGDKCRQETGSLNIVAVNERVGAVVTAALQYTPPLSYNPLSFANFFPVAGLERQR